MSWDRIGFNLSEKKISFIERKRENTRSRIIYNLLSELPDYCEREQRSVKSEEEKNVVRSFFTKVYDDVAPYLSSRNSDDVVRVSSLTVLHIMCPEKSTRTPRTPRLISPGVVIDKKSWTPRNFGELAH